MLSPSNIVSWIATAATRPRAILRLARQRSALAEFNGGWRRIEEQVELAVLLVVIFLACLWILTF